MARHKARKIIVNEQEFGWNYTSDGGFYIKTPDGKNIKVNSSDAPKDIQILVSNTENIKKEVITPRCVSFWISKNIFNSRELFVPKEKVAISKDYNPVDNTSIGDNYSFVITTTISDYYENETIYNCILDDEKKAIDMVKELKSKIPHYPYTKEDCCGKMVYINYNKVLKI